MYQGRSFSDSTTPRLIGLGTTSQYRMYDSKNFGLTVRQSLFNKSNYAAFNQTREAAYKSDAILKKENLNLMARICGSYLDILMALDNIEYSEMQKFNVEVQLQSAEERYKNGVGTITEINEAKSNLESVIAKKLEWDNALEYSRRILETYIGRYGRKEVFKGKPQPIDTRLPNDREIILVLNEIAKFLEDISTHIKDTDLLNIRDEILGNVNQTKYLFTLA